jgi:hypothetical protein
MGNEKWYRETTLRESSCQNERSLERSRLACERVSVRTRGAWARIICTSLTYKSSSRDRSLCCSIHELYRHQVRGKLGGKELSVLFTHLLRHSRPGTHTHVNRDWCDWYRLLSRQIWGSRGTHEGRKNWGCVGYYFWPISTYNLWYLWPRNDPIKGV